MRLKKMSLLMACICAGILVGCKATPEKEAISQKGDVTTVVAKNKIEVGKETIRSVVKAPESEKFEIVSESGNATVNVDAKVVVPETNGIPVAKVVNRDLSTLDLESLSKFFFDGNDYRYIRGIEEMSKAEITKMMEEQKAMMEDESIYEGFTEEEKEQYKKINQDYLLELQGHYDKAPETIEEVPIEYVLKAEEEEALGENAKTFSVESNKEGVVKNFMVMNGEYFNSLMFYTDGDMGSFAGYFDGYENKCKYSEEEAKQKSEEVIKMLDISGEYKLVRCVPTVAYSEESMMAADYYNGYQISYKRVIDGVEETYDATTLTPEENASQEGTSEEDISATMASIPQQYETIEFQFGKNGLSYVGWMEPMAVDTILAENVKMISYEEAIKVFKEKVFLNSEELSEEGLNGLTDEENAEVDSAKTEKINCSVDKIQLGLMRVKNKDNQGEYTLIPVWDFYGSYSESEDYDSSNSYLTINALDASIIDRSIGY